MFDDFPIESIAENKYQGIFISTEKIAEDIAKEKGFAYIQKVRHKGEIRGYKYYACSNEEHYGNSIFKYIYFHRKKIFQKLVGTKIEVNDDYIAKTFSDWEDKGPSLDKDTEDKWFECIVFSAIKERGMGIGWHPNYPLKFISINWEYRKSVKGKTKAGFILWEGDDIRTKLELRWRDKKNGLLRGVDDKHVIYALDWRNLRIRNSEEKFPLYTDDPELFKIDYQSFKVGIVKNKYEIDKQHQCEFPLSEIVDNLYQTLQKKDVYEWGPGKKTKDEPFSKTHIFLLKEASVNELKIIWDKTLYGEKVETLLNLEKEYISRLLHSIYAIAASRTHSDLVLKPRWLIVSDERFDTKERKLMVLYSIIPPGANGVGKTSAFYHSVESKLLYFDENKRLQKNIFENKKILNFSFLINNTSSKSEDIAEAVSNTFPIVVEILRNKIISDKYLETNLKIQFLSERIDNFEFKPGVNITIETSNEMKKRYKERGGLQFKTHLPFDLLPKYPNSHPYLQYPDIIGKKYSHPHGNNPDYLESILEFEGNLETFEELRNLILRAKKPLEFFEILIKSKNKYMADYCLNPNENNYHKSKYHQLVLGELIRENIDALYKREELEQLFTLIYNNSEEVSSRDIIRNILIEVYEQTKKPEVENNDILPKYKLTTRNKFEWLMQAFSFETHRDNSEAILEIRKMLKQIQDEEEYDYIEPSRIMDLKCLQLVSNQNVFSFGDYYQLSEEIEKIINKKNTSKREDNYAGAMALSLLLQCKDINSDKFNIAEKAENYLLRKVINEKSNPSIERRLTNSLEIKILKSSISQDNSVVLPHGKIGPEVLQDVYDNKEINSDYFSSPFYTAAVLKTIALTNFPFGKSKLKDFAINMLVKHIFIRKEHHWPNNRIAYWYIRACCRVNLNNNSEHCRINISKCTQLLFKMNKEKKSAIGIITACQLLDLFYRHGSLGDGAFSVFEFSKESEVSKWETIFWENYEEKVNYLLDKSWELDSTKKWFNDNKPDKQDRLKPLNFNYR